MKLAIAQSNLTLKGGAERIVLKIAQRYKAPIYVAEYDQKNTFEEFGDLDIRLIPKKGLLSSLPYGRASQGLTYGLGFYNLDLQDEFDVVNAHMAPSHWVRNRNERTMWYCHTPLRDIYDLYHYRMSMRSAYTRPIYIAGAAAVRSIDQRIVKQIPVILANSANIKSRISKYYGRSDARVLGGGVEFRKYSDKGDDRYFFYPSRISPNKRQDYAIEAFKIFSRNVKGYRLIICGPVSKDKFYYDYYKKILHTASETSKIEIMTDVSEDKLKDLYSRCTAVLYPPINEDYGLVPLEAMASGKPIIAVNEGGPRETVKDNKTGILVNSAEEMANAMVRVAMDDRLAARLGKAGKTAAKREYSWEAFFTEFNKYLKMTRNS
ncbi:MAG: glycosyltransferase family 4 protein [Candidatus Micrarchaeota archaeon]|nr:glycosyltransferase family 4 protein [Candidatus Micrarchaeota archaeon]